MNKKDKNKMENPMGEVIVYQTDDGKIKLDVRLEDETVWLTQQLIAQLFQTTVPNISMHIRNIFEEGELCSGSRSRVVVEARGSISWIKVWQSQ